MLSIKLAQGQVDDRHLAEASIHAPARAYCVMPIQPDCAADVFLACKCSSVLCSQAPSRVVRSSPWAAKLATFALFHLSADLCLQHSLAMTPHNLIQHTPDLRASI